MSESGLVLVHHDAPDTPAFREWLEREYFPAIMPIMGVKRVTRLRAISTDPLPRPYLTVLHTEDVRRTVTATDNPSWQALAAEAVERGVAQRLMVPYQQVFQLDA
ncbi:MAG TPA: hypothetical protein VKU60_12755 [Chloroflexota bacterium]|nr:hypothetical protein [Chloroflexota bacterium]